MFARPRPMPKITQMQVGLVFVRETAPNKWRASWTDPLTKRHIRRVLPVSSFQDAKKKAQGINDEIAHGHGFSGRLGGSVGHCVSDAIVEAVKHTDANDKTRKEYL